MLSTKRVQGYLVAAFRDLAESGSRAAWNVHEAERSSQRSTDRVYQSIGN